MIGLYIHVPFCRQRCPYCAFYKEIPRNDFKIEEYLRALDMELSEARGRVFDTIYVGGGTPNMLKGKQLIEFLEIIHKYVRLREDYEWTFEMNPELVDIDSLEILKSYGVNRLSLGVQSIYDEELRFFARLHRYRTVVKRLELIRRVGFDNVSVDLIFGSPLKTPDMWRRELEEVVSWEVEHISTYHLTIEEGTPFERMGVRNPDDETMVRLYRIRDEVLSKHGFVRYEISNYAKPGRESRHNTIYWLHHEYMGFGPSAHSFLKPNVRYTNVSSLKKYIEDYEKHREYEYLTEEQLLLERIFLGIRTIWGVEVGQVDLSGLEVYVEYRGGRIRLTDKGILIADRLALEIYERISRSPLQPSSSRPSS